MFLQNLYVWKPFRAIAALMLVLVMMTACQEIAQVINKPVTTVSGSENSSPMASTIAAKSAPLTDEEKAFGMDMLNDKNFQELTQMRQVFIFKLKIALAQDRNALKQAIIKNDTKRFVRRPKKG
jgi:hypothetical protein